MGVLKDLIDWSSIKESEIFLLRASRVHTKCLLKKKYALAKKIVEKYPKMIEIGRDDMTMSFGLLLLMRSKNK